MFKLLRNYIREQKHNLLQLFGLGFLVIVMIVGFLALNFSNNYVKKQYVNDIINNTFDQDVSFNLESGNFFTNYSKKRNDSAFFSNINYYKKANKAIVVNGDKMQKATFNLKLLNPAEQENANKIYRFTFHGGKKDSSEYFAIGDNLFAETTKEYLDFKITIPNNYPTVATHKATINNIAAILEKYIDDGTNQTKDNKTNFFITSYSALQYYNKNLYKKLAYANCTYDSSDITNNLLLYKIMVLGVLYQDVQWNHVNIINDLLISSKNFAFIETNSQYTGNVPLLVKNGGESLARKPLQDNEILIYEQFAKLNNLHIGQSYNIAGQIFIIRGYATSSVATYVGNYFGGVLDLKNNTIAFVNSNTMQKVETQLKTFRSINGRWSFLTGFHPEKIKETANLNNEWIFQYLHHRYNNSNVEKAIYLANGIDYNALLAPLDSYLVKIFTTVQSSTFNFINSRIAIIKKIATLFLVLIFIVTVIIIFIIIFKMIDRNKKLIGVLKLTGYKNWQLSISLVISIIVPLFLFAFAGILLAIPLAHFLINITNVSMLALISYGWYFNFSTAALLITTPIVSLTFISFLIVLFLLRRKPLDLITNNYAKKKYKVNIGLFFTFITKYIIRNFNYRNKLAITTSMHSFGKVLLMSATSIFAATLVLFAFAGTGLVNNMLGMQFAGTNFNYKNSYKFTNEVVNNFISNDKKLLYQFNIIDNIKKQPSLLPELKNKITDFINDPTKPVIVDMQNRYLMGSELLTIRNFINSQSDNLPSLFIKFLDDNKVLLDYLTNDNGHNNDLMLSFGLIPFAKNREVPYTELILDNAYSLFLNQPNTSFDNEKQVLSPDCFSIWAPSHRVYGVDDSLKSFLSPNLALSSFTKFSNLTLQDMLNSNNWQDQQFIDIRNKLIKQLNIIDPDNSAVQFIPMATSSLPVIKGIRNGGEPLGKAVIYPYQGLDKQQKYIIGIAYDYFNKLDANIILMPKLWLNNILFSNKNAFLQTNFANTKLSKLNDNEFKHYLPIISTNNAYKIDLTKIATTGYLEKKGISTSLNAIFDINNIYRIVKTAQYSLQVVIIFFGFFSVILSLMVIIIITNISVRDNLVLINILRSLGYSASEVSYNFFLVMLPVIIISSLGAVFFVPTLVEILANLLTSFSGIFFPIIFRWWFFALMILINILINMVSYVITWKLNVNNKELMNLTK